MIDLWSYCVNDLCSMAYISSGQSLKQVVHHCVNELVAPVEVNK